MRYKYALNLKEILYNIKLFFIKTTITCPIKIRIQRYTKNVGKSSVNVGLWKPYLGTLQLKVNSYQTTVQN